jgi:hypothetical protein
MPSHPSDNRSTPHATGKQKGRSASRWIDGGILVFIFIFAAFAPHSIAVAQAAWIVGMLLWVVRFAFFQPCVAKLYSERALVKRSLSAIPD